jgi:thiol-disulfide isomerase/thioredoxin
MNHTWNSLPRRILLAMGLALLCLTACGLRPPDAPLGPADPSALPEYSSQTLKEYLGQIVVVNFWATWCLPCRMEMPALEAVYQSYHDDGVVVLGVNVGDSNADIVAFAEEEGLTFPLLRDPLRQVARASNVRVIPTTLFIDRQGEEQHRTLGSVTESLLREQIQALLE